MRSLNDRLDQAFSEDISRPYPINEVGLLRKLFPVGRKSTQKEMQPVQQADIEPEPEPEPEPVEKTKASEAPTTHIASYAIARGKGFLRVGVEGDKSLTKARLHIFKKGNRYFGFLVIPGPGGKRAKAEGFQYQVMMILEMDIYEAVSDVVLKYDSDDLGDLLDLSNYQDRSGLDPSKFKDYEKEVKLLDVDAAEKANIGRLPWGKEQRQTMRQEDPVDIDVNKLRELSEKYEELAKKESNEVVKFMYEMMGEATSKMTTKSQLQSVIDNTERAIDRLKEKGDPKSMRKAKVYERMIEDFVEALKDLDI